MDFTLTEEQKMLSKTARGFLEAECPASLVKEMTKSRAGYPIQLYRKMAGLGWMGLPIPVKYGGGGGSFLDLVILLGEMGRACLPGPYFSSTVVGSTGILEGGDEEQRQRFLPEIAQGNLVFTIALLEINGKCDPRAIQAKAVANGKGYLLEGKKLFVHDADSANYIICVCRTGDDDQHITPFIVSTRSEKIHLVPLATMVGDKQFEVLLDKVAVPADSMLGELNQGWSWVKKVIQKAAIASCAQMVGGAQKVLELTVEYAKQRVQFGRPIGSFEVIQHYCANMLMDLEGARFITYLAAWKLSQGLPFNMEASAAKIWVNQAYQRIVSLGERIHGGVGFMLDHDMPLYLRRASQAEVLWGDSDYHREIVAQELGM